MRLFTATLLTDLSAARGRHGNSIDGLILYPTLQRAGVGSWSTGATSCGR